MTYFLFKVIFHCKQMSKCFPESHKAWSSFLKTEMAFGLWQEAESNQVQPLEHCLRSETIFYSFLHQMLRTEPAGTQCVWKRIEYGCTWLTVVFNLHIKQTHIQWTPTLGQCKRDWAHPDVSTLRSSQPGSGLTVWVLILSDNVSVPYHRPELSDLSLILTESLSHEHWHLSRNSFNAKAFASTSSYSWLQVYLGIWKDPWKDYWNELPQLFLYYCLCCCVWN